MTNFLLLAAVSVLQLTWHLELDTDSAIATLQIEATALEAGELRLFPEGTVYRELRSLGQPAVAPVRDGWHVLRTPQGRVSVSAVLPLEDALSLARPAAPIATVGLRSSQEMTWQIAGIGERRGKSIDMALPGSLAEFAVRWERAQPIVPRAGDLSVTPSIAWTVAPQGLVARAQLRLNIAGGTRSELELTIPHGADRVTLSGPELRKFTREGDRLQVYLRSAIRGRSELHLGFEIPGAASGEFHLPEIGVPGARLVEGGWTLVANEVGGELLELKTRGLDPRGTGEAPGDLLSELGAPITYAYRRSSRTPQSSFDLVTTSPFPLVDTIADESIMTCVLRPDGQELMRWQLRMRNNRRQFVRVRLPAGARVMHVKVEGELRQASVDGDLLLLPLVKSVQTLGGLIAFPVELVYVRQGRALADSAARALALPVLIDAPIAQAKLDLMLPKGRRLSGLEGPWQEAELSEEYLDIGHGYCIDSTIGTTQSLSGGLRFEKELGRNYWREGYEAYKANRLEEAETSFNNALSVSRDPKVIADANALLGNIWAGRGEVEGGRETRAKASRIQKGLAGDNVKLASRQQGLIEKGLKQLALGDEWGASVLLEDAQRLGEQLSTRGAAREQVQIEAGYLSKLSSVSKDAEKNRKLKSELKSLKGKAQEVLAKSGEAAAQLFLQVDDALQEELLKEDESGVDEALLVRQGKRVNKPKSIRLENAKLKKQTQALRSALTSPEPNTDATFRASSPNVLNFSEAAPALGDLPQVGRLFRAQKRLEVFANVASSGGEAEQQQVAALQKQVEEQQKELASQTDVVVGNVGTDSVAFQRFVTKNYDLDGEITVTASGDIVATNTDKNSEQVAAVVDNLFANSGQSVTLRSSSLGVDLDSRSKLAGEFNASTKSGRSYALLDRAQLQTLTELGGKPVSGQEQREAIVGTPNTISGVGVKIQQAGVSSNTVVVDGTTIAVPHGKFLCVANPGGLANITTISTSLAHDWLEAPVGVTAAPRTPVEFNVPLPGTLWSYEKQVVEPGERLDAEVFSRRRGLRFGLRARTPH